MTSGEQALWATRAPGCARSASLVRLWMKVIPRNERVAGARVTSEGQRARTEHNEGVKR